MTLIVSTGIDVGEDEVEGILTTVRLQDIREKTKTQTSKAIIFGSRVLEMKESTDSGQDDKATERGQGMEVKKDDISIYRDLSLIQCYICQG